MKQFSEVFDENIINTQVPINKIDKIIKNTKEKKEKLDDNSLIEQKRERNDT